MAGVPLDTETLAQARPSEALEAALEAVERPLGALGTALRDRDSGGVERHAADLHRALALAIHRFTRASQRPEGVSPALRQRLARTAGQVEAQRECLARAASSLDRELAILIPTLPVAGLYGVGGQSARATTSASAQA
jgi:alkylation response protein AidB-like acyl-CoA dehydrogenase